MLKVRSLFKPANLGLRHLAGLLVLSFSSLALSQTLYVSSQQAKLLSEPNFKAESVATLALGSEVNVIQTEGAWNQVTTADGATGWLSKFLARPTPPIERVTVLPPGIESDLKDVRRRTSAITTAAAARGLSTRSGTDTGTETYASDLEAVQYMESITVTPEALERFTQPISQGAR